MAASAAVIERVIMKKVIIFLIYIFFSGLIYIYHGGQTLESGRPCDIVNDQVTAVTLLSFQERFLLPEIFSVLHCIKFQISQFPVFSCQGIRYIFYTRIYH